MVRASEPALPVTSRPDDILIEDLCLSLRDVGVRNGLREPILLVQETDRELTARGVEVGDRLDALSRETGWRMKHLLEECRLFPEITPRVRLLSGLRKDQLCFACRERERPDDPTRFLVCTECLVRMRDALRTRRSHPRMFLFRTYSPEARCKHATDETVLVVYPWWRGEDAEAGACQLCIEEEIEKRSASSQRGAADLRQREI
jgi:hypothetical protein